MANISSSIQDPIQSVQIALTPVQALYDIASELTLERLPSARKEFIADSKKLFEEFKTKLLSDLALTCELIKEESLLISQIEQLNLVLSKLHDKSRENILPENISVFLESFEKSLRPKILVKIEKSLSELIDSTIQSHNICKSQILINLELLNQQIKENIFFSSNEIENLYKKLIESKIESISNIIDHVEELKFSLKPLKSSYIEYISSIEKLILEKSAQLLIVRSTNTQNSLADILIRALVDTIINFSHVSIEDHDSASRSNIYRNYLEPKLNQLSENSTASQLSLNLELILNEITLLDPTKKKGSERLELLNKIDDILWYTFLSITYENIARIEQKNDAVFTEYLFFDESDRKQTRYHNTKIIEDRLERLQPLVIEHSKPFFSKGAFSSIMNLKDAEFSIYLQSLEDISSLLRNGIFDLNLDNNRELLSSINGLSELKNKFADPFLIATINAKNIYPKILPEINGILNSANLELPQLQIQIYILGFICTNHIKTSMSLNELSVQFPEIKKNNLNSSLRALIKSGILVLNQERTEYLLSHSEVFKDIHKSIANLIIPDKPLNFPVGNVLDKTEVQTTVPNTHSLESELQSFFSQRRNIIILSIAQSVLHSSFGQNQQDLYLAMILEKIDFNQRDLTLNERLQKIRQILVREFKSLSLPTILNIQKEPKPFENKVKKEVNRYLKELPNKIDFLLSRLEEYKDDYTAERNFLEKMRTIHSPDYTGILNDENLQSEDTPFYRFKVEITEIGVEFASLSNSPEAT